MGIAVAPGASAASEIQVLLRKRLRFVGLLGAAFYTFLTLVAGPAMFRPDAVGAFRRAAVAVVALWLVFCVLTALLWSRKDLSVRGLRTIEAVAFGLVLAHAALTRYEVLLHRFGERTAFERILTELPPTSPPITAQFFCFPFFALVVFYGTLIPNPWKRALAMVGPMALAPVTVYAGAAVHLGLLTPGVALAGLPMIANMAVGAALALHGTHRIEALRREAVKARRLGQYQLGHRLASGGMGDVYLAEHILLRRPCAIKLIRADRAGDLVNLRRFEREVRTTATLTSWHTVEIYDYGHAADGTFYYVMEYLPGLNLEQLVAKEGPLAPGRAVHLLRQVCLALHEAHEVGLIHRDVKPANIISSQRGGLPDVAKLLDFGLVRAVRFGDGDSADLTREGLIAGTPSYMSPEQAAGSEALDARSDVYSLGAVGYFLLTAQPPFVRDTTMRVIAAHISESVVPPDRVRGGVPEELQAVVLRCLEKDPARRFASAKSLEAALAVCDVGS